jgi:hypothetical protein
VRPPKRTSRALVLVLVVSMLALTACGGGGAPSASQSGVSAPAYVKSICGTLTTWKNDIQSAGGQLQTGSSAAKSLADGKQQYVVFITSLVAATRKAAVGLKAAGVPSVHNGSDIATSLQGAFARASASLNQAVARAKAIPTTNAHAYQAATSGVTNQFKQSLSGIASLTPKDNAQLNAAAAQEPSCKALTSA